MATDVAADTQPGAVKGAVDPLTTTTRPTRGGSAGEQGASQSRDDARDCLSQPLPLCHNESFRHVHGDERADGEPVHPRHRGVSRSRVLGDRQTPEDELGHETQRHHSRCQVGHNGNVGAHRCQG